jgi:biopolymer transport protein ExbB
VLEIIIAAGWPIYPLILASIVAIAIIVERAWTLRSELIVPSNLLPEVKKWLVQGAVTKETCDKLQAHSLLGEVFASALSNASSSRDVIKESIEESGRAVAHKLEKHLSTLGTIATVSPLLGVWGTVIGMVELFGAFNAAGSGHDVAQFAKGISVALYNTAFGLIVAIPSLMFWRYFRAVVDRHVLDMEVAAETFARHLSRARA